MRVAPKCFERRDVRFEIRVAGEAAAVLGLRQRLQHAFASQERTRPEPPKARCDPLSSSPAGRRTPRRRQLALHRFQAVPLEIEAGRHQHHAFRRDAVELVGVHVGVDVRNDVAELVPRINVTHI